MELYNKLVRDKIPEIIAKQGKSVSFRALQGDELKKALKDKLIEEVDELLKAETQEKLIEEMTDVYEVLYAIASADNICAEIMDKRLEKYDEKGGLEKGYFLEYVTEGANP